ncbi:MAG: PAS domain S-box protein [Nostoc sp.]
MQQEISDRQKAESALRLSQFYLDRFKAPIFFVNLNAQLVYVNEAACHILGYSREQLLTMTVHDIDPNFPAETWHSQWQELREKDSSSFESIHRTQDSRNLHVKITFSHLEFKDQQYLCTSAYYSNPIRLG